MVPNALCEQRINIFELVDPSESPTTSSDRIFVSRNAHPLIKTLQGSLTCSRQLVQDHKLILATNAELPPLRPDLLIPLTLTTIIMPVSSSSFVLLASSTFPISMSLIPPSFPRLSPPLECSDPLPVPPPSSTSDPPPMTFVIHISSIPSLVTPCSVFTPLSQDSVPSVEEIWIEDPSSTKINVSVQCFTSSEE